MKTLRVALLLGLLLVALASGACTSGGGGGGCRGCSPDRNCCDGCRAGTGCTCAR